MGIIIRGKEGEKETGFYRKKPDNWGLEREGIGKERVVKDQEPKKGPRMAVFPPEFTRKAVTLTSPLSPNLAKTH